MTVGNHDLAHENDVPPCSIDEVPSQPNAAHLSTKDIQEYDASDRNGHRHAPSSHEVRNGDRPSSKGDIFILLCALNADSIARQEKAMAETRAEEEEDPANSGRRAVEKDCTGRCKDSEDPTA